MVRRIRGNPPKDAPTAAPFLVGMAAFSLLYFPVRWTLAAFQDHEEHDDSPQHHSPTQKQRPAPAPFKPNYVAPLIVVAGLVLFFLYLLTTGGPK